MNFALTTNPCGSELARESAGSACIEIEWAAVIASKLAPTGGQLQPYDWIRDLGHKFRANIGHRAGYCRELDSHKGFAA